MEKRVVATLLTLMDGVSDASHGENRPGVVVIGATNRPNALDEALRRPGRFDREVEIGDISHVAHSSLLHSGIPNVASRYSILSTILRKIPHNLQDEQIQSLAATSHGYVGADLSAVCREAGLKCINRLSVDESWEQSRDMQSKHIERRETVIMYVLSFCDINGTLDVMVTFDDMKDAMAEIRPSAMREVNNYCKETRIFFL
jgi:AAA family ATPase